jgi:hypothetical protein
MLGLATTLIANEQARVLQPFPLTVPSLQNTCFFARLDSIIDNYFKTQYLNSFTKTFFQLSSF